MLNRLEYSHIANVVSQKLKLANSSNINPAFSDEQIRYLSLAIISAIIEHDKLTSK